MITTVGLLLIVTLLVVVYLCIRKIYALYRIIDEIKLNPLERKREKITQRLSTDFFIYGDSHIECWFNFPIVNHLNYAVCGQTSAQLVLRSADIFSQIEAKYTILSAGGNDIKAIAMLPSRKDEIMSKALVNIKYLIEASPAEKTILMIAPRIFHIPMRYYLADVKTGEQSLLEWNDMLRGLASDNVIIFDLNYEFEQVKNRRQYSDDGIHFNHKGYLYVNEKLLALLDTMGYKA